MKKFIAMALVLVLVAALSVGGTLAYLQYQDSDVNTMTMYNVKIEQMEYERVLDANGVVTGMKKFNNNVNHPLFPAVITGDATAKNAWAPANPANQDDLFWYKKYLGEDYPGGNGLWENLNNVQDKFVFVKNTGTTDAYYRTIILLEADTTGTTNSSTGQSLIHLNTNSHSQFTWANNTGDITDETMVVEVNGKKYTVEVATCNVPLEPGKISRPSLLQIGMDQEATNEYVAQFGETYDVLVLSQAVQTAGFENANDALNTAFGEVNTTNVVEWFKNIAPSNTNSGI